MAKKITNTLIIIPTYGNFYIDVKRAVSSLSSQVGQNNIVVVDVSPGITVKKVKRDFSKIKCIVRERNSGPAGGRNDGLVYVAKKYKYILFFDHDMEALPGMVSELIERAKKSKVIGIVTPKIVYNEDRSIVWSAGTDINLRTGQVIFYGGHDNDEFNVSKRVAIAPATLLVKKELLNVVHGFNEKYQTTYEDSEFCLRAAKLGWETWYEAKACAIHHLSLDISQSRNRLLARSYFVSRNRIWFMRQYSKSFGTFCLYVPIYICYYLFMAISNKDYKSAVNYIRGTIDGFKTYS